MKCVYCKSEKIVKNGKSNQGKQRYLCKECGKIFVENPERRHYSNYLKKIAIRLYTDGVEIAVIARSLEVPYETVRSWIRAEGEKAIKKMEVRKKKFQNKEFEKAGLDEMQTYIGKKENDIWIWTAVFDKRYKFFEIGKRN